MVPQDRSEGLAMVLLLSKPSCLAPPGCAKAVLPFSQKSPHSVKSAPSVRGPDCPPRGCSGMIESRACGLSLTGATNISSGSHRWRLGTLPRYVNALLAFFVRWEALSRAFGRALGLESLARGSNPCIEAMWPRVYPVPTLPVKTPLATVAQALGGFQVG